MCEGEEQKENAACAQEGRQQIDHHCHMSGIACKMRKEVGYQHEDWRTRRVTDFQLVTTGDEFRTVPQAGSWFYGQSVDNGSNGKHEPCRTGVDSLECCLLHHTSLEFFCESSNK